MTQIKCTSEYRQDKPNDEIDPKALAAWLVTLPEGCHLQAIIYQAGSQHDPVDVFRGVKASWTEER